MLPTTVTAIRAAAVLSDDSRIYCFDPTTIVGDAATFNRWIHLYGAPSAQSLIGR